MNRAKFDGLLEKLSPTQNRVLKLFLSGMPDSDIKDELGCTDASNIRKHISNICKKFGLENDVGEHYCYRDELIEIFIRYRPDWVPLDVASKYVPSEVPPVPGRGLQAGSRFYIERQNIEVRSQQLLRNAQAGRLFRIFAPRRSGIRRH